MRLFLRKIKAFFENTPKNNIFKKCKRCNRPMNKVLWPPMIYVFIGDAPHFLMPICNDCWNELTVAERIKHLNNGYSFPRNIKDSIITQVCKYENIDSKKYLRKLKLRQINENGFGKS